MGTYIAGTGRCVPGLTVTNEMLEAIVDTSDEWITKRTGIKTRHLIKDETVTVIAAGAAKKALESAGADPEDIGLIVASTITGDFITPALSSCVQRELGIARAVTLDVQAGCTGFVHALAVADSLMERLNIGCALVVAAEAMSRGVDWTDRRTCVLFGDGAGAVILKKGQYGLGAAWISGKPDTGEVLVIPGNYVTHPWNEAQNDKAPVLSMKGTDVYEFACSAMVEAINELSAMQPGFQKIIPHQANARIINYASQKSGIPIENFYMNVQDYANTSSASIAIALDEAWRNGWLRSGESVALVGFGAGLTWGGIVINWALPDFN